MITLSDDIPVRTLKGYGLFSGIVRSAVGILVFLFFSVANPNAQSHFTDDLIVKELEMRRAVKTLVLDSEGFLWIGTDVGLYRFDGYEFDLVGGETLSHLPVPATRINQMILDAHGNLWLSAQAQIYGINKERSRVLIAEKPVTDFRIDEEITSILEVRNEIWAVDLSSEIKCYAPFTDTTTQLVPKRQILFPGYNLRFLFSLGDGNVLVSTNLHTYFVISPSGEILSTNISSIEYPAFYANAHTSETFLLAENNLYKLDPYQNILRHEASLSPISKRHSPTWFIPGLYYDEKGYWLGNKEGNLIWYATETKQIHNVTPLLDDRIYAGRFFSTHAGIGDGADGIWIGTNQGLIHGQVPQMQHFQTLPNPLQGERQNFSVRGLIRLPDRSIFVASYSGLFRYYPNGTIREYKILNDEIKRTVNPLAYDFLQLNDSTLWLATEGNGLLGFDIVHDSLYWAMSNAYLQSLGEGQKEALWQFRIFRDHSNMIWLGTMNGLATVSGNGIPERVLFESGDMTPLLKVFDIRETSDRNLWIASSNGFFRIPPERKSIHKMQLPEFIRSEITCLHPVSDHTFLIGTRQNGILFYDASNEESELFTSAHGLADNSVCAIQSIDNDIFWIATNRGLSRFHLSERTFNNFYIEDGLPDNEFNHGSWMKDTDGALYFGGVGGVSRIDPRGAIPEKSMTRLRVSKIAYHDGKTGTTRYMPLLPGKTPAIKLGFRDKYFTVHYSSTNCIPNSMLTYAYMLEGLHSDWQLNETKNFVQFTGLQAGHYTLKIRTVEASLQEGDVLHIPVHIAGPFYQQWWAYLLYIILIGGISFLIFRTYFQQKHIERRLELESEHRQKLEEINKSKSTFFTNITHEFKTPLTLIQVPAEEITRISKDVRINKHAQFIAKNAQSMLSLVNQLLELGKLEAKIERPQFYRRDLIKHVRLWLGNFESAAMQKGITLTLQSTMTSLYTDFDPVKLEIVVNNLLSNAIKFTPAGGHVTCVVATTKDSVELDQVSITVEDDGTGIDPEEQKHVFERFYQGSNSKLGGTGIGLAYVYEMIQLHNGSIQLDSSPAKGTRFTVLLPMYQQSVLSEEAFTHSETSNATARYPTQTLNTFNTNEKMVLLVAEDNEDVAQLIHEVFSSDFQVVLTLNGRDAHLKAMEIVPDIIITDVMMPVMDGLTLTHQLKQDKHTSHIPVIMLTARDGVSARIEGKSQGADAYLNKPFSVSELKLTVRNLLHLRDQVMQHVSQQVETDVSGVHFTNEQDSSFYQSFLKILERNLSEPALSVQDFVRELGVSRTQLHRKMKALTGHSVNHLVRNMRLQRALSLLKHSGKTISEIAYEVGFSSPSYFTERFREYYGYPPSEVLNQEATGPQSGS